MSAHLTHLRQLREQRKLSLRELAMKADVPKGQLSMAERGLTLLPPTKLGGLEQALGLQPGTLSYRTMLVTEEL